jgi:type III pantothenate kinase
MLLLIDAGNTRIKWAMLGRQALAGAPLGHWSAYGTVRREDAGQLNAPWRDAGISKVLVSNVAGPDVSDLLEGLLLQAAGMKPVPIEWFKSCAALAGVRNAYREPGKLGADRFAAVIGAHALFPSQPLLVVCCGTATTINALGADGSFAGGLILPGLGTMARSLAADTAQLPHVASQLEQLASFPDNTEAGIAAGCLAAQAGAIERAFATHARQNGAAQCIISGGAAGLIAPSLSIPFRTIDNLVLIGLQAVAKSQIP